MYTLSIPSRNSFHSAWLLLPVPAVLAWLFSESLLGSLTPVLISVPPLFAAVRFVLLLALVAPLAWLAFQPVRPRTGRRLKELRAQLPGALLAILVPGLMALVPDLREWMAFPYVAGCCLLGATTLGAEFEQRTLPGLLAQPVSREAILGDKLLVLGGLLFMAALQLLLTQAALPQRSGDDSESLPLLLLLLPIMVFCTGPLFSLLTRSTLAGLVFILAIPAVLWMAVRALLSVAFRLGNPGEVLPEPPPGFTAALWIGTPLYLMATAALGWVCFRRLELRDGGAGPLAPQLHPLSHPLDALLARLLPSGGTAALVRKELRLQVVPWLVAGIIVVGWLLGLVAYRYMDRSEAGDLLTSRDVGCWFAGLFGFLALLTAGAGCVAEERQLGTLDWQLTQRVTVRRQWWVKFGVAVAVGVGLGVLLPLVLLRLTFGAELFAGPPSYQPWFEQLLPPLLLLGAVLGVFTLAAYASSLCRNTMQAVAAAMGIGIGLWMLVFLVVMGMQLQGEAWMEALALEGQSGGAVTQWLVVQQDVMKLLLVGLCALTVIVVSVTLAVLAGRNFRRSTMPGAVISRQLIALAVGIAVFVGLVALLVFGLEYQRVAGMWAESQRVGWNRSPVPAVATPVQGSASAYSMDPVLARRYGLTGAVPGVTNAASTNPPTAQPGKNLYQLDPVLARRYGLTPQTNAP